MAVVVLGSNQDWPIRKPEELPVLRAWSERATCWGVVVKNAAQEALGHFPTLVSTSYPFSNHGDPHPIMPLKARLKEKGPTCKFLLQFPIHSGFIALRNIKRECHLLPPSLFILSGALQACLCHWFVAQDEPEPAIRKSYQAVERHGETIRVRDTVLLKSGPRKTSTPYVAKISALWENPESGTPCLKSDLALFLAQSVFYLARVYLLQSSAGGLVTWIVSAH